MRYHLLKVHCVKMMMLWQFFFLMIYLYLKLRAVFKFYLIFMLKPLTQLLLLMKFQILSYQAMV